MGTPVRSGRYDIGDYFEERMLVRILPVNVAAGATPTKAEFDALVTAFNNLVADLRAKTLMR